MLQSNYDMVPYRQGKVGERWCVWRVDRQMKQYLTVHGWSDWSINLILFRSEQQAREYASEHVGPEYTKV